MQIGYKDPVPGSFFNYIGVCTYLSSSRKQFLVPFPLVLDDLGFCIFHQHVRQVMIQANKRYLPADNEFC